VGYKGKGGGNASDRNATRGCEDDLTVESKYGEESVQGLRHG
jgi:hypothetical protein